jgi:hypothetical protein
MCGGRPDWLHFACIKLVKAQLPKKSQLPRMQQKAIAFLFNFCAGIVGNEQGGWSGRISSLLHSCTGAAVRHRSCL